MVASQSRPASDIRMESVAHRVTRVRALDVQAASLRGELPAAAEERLAELLAEVAALQVAEVATLQEGEEELAEVEEELAEEQVRRLLVLPPFCAGAGGAPGQPAAGRHGRGGEAAAARRPGRGAAGAAAAGGARHPVGGATAPGQPAARQVQGHRRPHGREGPGGAGGK